MTAHRGVNGPLLVGRDAELGTLNALITAADDGESGTLLISGEAGAGKTVLVQEACSRARADAVILSGACLPMNSLAVPLLPLRAVLRHAPSAPGFPVPRLDSRTDAPAETLLALDDWLDWLSRDHVVVLAIDDLQWADQDTLDVLMFLLAGPADRRLAILGTIRTESLTDEHPLTRWLADVRRLPRVKEVSLGPLDRFATEAQIAALIGGRPHQSLVDEVFSHTEGRPYLTRLIVTGLTPTTRHLPPDLPADLGSAVLQSWRRLSPDAREITNVLAVKARPASADELDTITGRTDAGTLLADAVEAGILTADRDARYWFRHPLTPEVLEQRLPEDERRRRHGVFAAHYESQVTDAATARLDALIDVADHHFRAGHAAEAYRWTLRASLRVAEFGGSTELIRLLRRALDLREAIPEPEAEESRLDLLDALRTAAREAGAHEDELLAVETLLAELDPAEDPLRAAELTVRRMHLRFSTGRGFLSPVDANHAVELAAADEDSWQYALALSEAAHARLWQDDPAAADLAETALRLARRAGHPGALSYALTANAMLAIIREHGAEGLALATEAVNAALDARDYWAFSHASLWEGNALDTWATRTVVEHLRGRREQLASLGAPHTYVAWFSASEAGGWLAIGEWPECEERLRVVIAADPGAGADVSGRLTAARLAALQGRADEAQGHLARADELFAETTEFLAFEFDAIRAEVLLALGDPGAAFDAAMAGATSPGVAPTMCEWLLPLAARALADQLQRAADERADATALHTRLDDLIAAFPHVIRDLGEPTESWDRQVDALQTLYEAEVGRGRGEADNATQWLHTVEACRWAGLPWEECYAAWRAAESLLTHGHADRERAASVMRSGFDLAESLQAAPVLTALRELASTARIPLSRPRDRTDPHRDDLPGLTAREREILDHVVAGRTYGQIARSLTISEKTVSSHISNLLRKTGTANRVDLARLATRAVRHPPGDRS